MHLLETTVEWCKKNWDHIKVDGIAFSLQCTDTRFESYWLAAASRRPFAGRLSRLRTI